MPVTKVSPDVIKQAIAQTHTGHNTNDSGGAPIAPEHSDAGNLSTDRIFFRMSSTADFTVPTASRNHGVDLDIPRDDFHRDDTLRDRFTEAKDGFKTSEFYVMVAFVVTVLLATYLDSDSLAREDGWRFAAFAVVAYIISRGLAKLGVSQPTTRRDH
jgi:hypothetical protein